jgi:hypothetical protein
MQDSDDEFSLDLYPAAKKKKLENEKSQPQSNYTEFERYLFEDEKGSISEGSQVC